MTTTPNAASLARLSLHDPQNFPIQHAQTLHRLTLLQHWHIPPGAKVLELGCGQGDCTTVLAAAVGDQGRVVAVDPADGNYGAPYTLGEAQHHISLSPLGKRITWIQRAPLDYLSTLTGTFDAAVLAHSLWYFASPALILATFKALRQHSKRLLLAEWALRATQAAAQPHVLAVLAQAALECRKTESGSNVRTVLSPKGLLQLAVAAGWRLEGESCVESGVGLMDGQWEVSACLSSGFAREVEGCVGDERERGVVTALRDACEASLRGVPEGLKGVSSMDVWVASFV